MPGPGLESKDDQTVSRTTCGIKEVNKVIVGFIEDILGLYCHDYYLCIEDLAHIDADVEADCLVPQQKSKFSVFQPGLKIFTIIKIITILSTCELGPRTCLV